MQRISLYMKKLAIVFFGLAVGYIGVSAMLPS